MFPEGQVDEVVLGVSAIFDETERRPLPVDAVSADRVAHRNVACASSPPYTVSFALREHRWILIARAQVPHPKLVADSGPRTVVDDVLRVRGQGRPAGERLLRDAPGSSCTSGHRSTECCSHRGKERSLSAQTQPRVHLPGAGRLFGIAAANPRDPQRQTSETSRSIHSMIHPSFWVLGGEGEGRGGGGGGGVVGGGWGRGGGLGGRPLKTGGGWGRWRPQERRGGGGGRGRRFQRGAEIAPCGGGYSPQLLLKVFDPKASLRRSHRPGTGTHVAPGRPACR